ncbi:thiamine pyrophosphokinase-related protein-like protein [Pseudovirgaria hyperparasitica]|uniref:Thiamine pyrophosphokinase-related protein-like protein n=1 Tax=Pseudovirgaria hyperparasitica TaxID=470096 RepID=A0A6A6VZR7_9PEZI|nr:thiamine pyrophosphokinase-related protein-like protein [Pseudovirgaria hyperparasitica]KAF2755379.1 thiamine pyrophosphokinase-related protein-like protein [Pseudovirgaria hyperparasitica]
MSRSNLDLVNECDGFPYHQVDAIAYAQHVATYYHFQVEGFECTIGYLLPSVAEVLRGLPNWELDDDERTITLIGCNNAPERTVAMTATAMAMKATGHFKVLEKWRNEQYGVYGPRQQLLFDLERSATPLFGLVTYGVHMNAYVKSKAGELKIWIPRRAKTKQTYGGMLDNAVAGGISSGEKPYECLVRESSEEASLQEDIVRKNVKAAGTVTYFYIRDERAGGETNLLQPECQYVYDLELPEDVIPKPNDDEVEQFYLWTVGEVRKALARGEFKPNCAMVMLDFFIRHGIITPENEDDYIEIVSRLHRRLEFPTL